MSGNIIPVICYKAKVPTIYNKGTPHEKSCDTFLECYAPNGNPELGQARVDEWNK